jgi:protein-S-isoprenylcysteine O-methyltransferase Ste14
MTGLSGWPYRRIISAQFPAAATTASALKVAIGMLNLPAVWLLYPTSGLLLILTSCSLARSDRFRSKGIRSAFVVLGALSGLTAFAIAFLRQPRLLVPLLNYGLGLPLSVLGLVGRVYPMIHLRRRGTTTAMGGVDVLVDSGPYACVRHPQYASGFVLLAGWYLLSGAVYSLLTLPLIGGVICMQALVEERYVLESTFGMEYVEYRRRVGMLVPRLPRGRSKQPRAIEPNGGSSR